MNVPILAPGARRLKRFTAISLAVLAALVFSGAAFALSQVYYKNAENYAFGPGVEAVSDSEADGGRTVRFEKPGKWIEDRSAAFSAPATELQIKVRGNNNASTGYGTFAVLVDGSEVARRKIASTSYQTLNISIPQASLASGSHVVRVIRPSGTRGGNVFIDYVRFTGGDGSTELPPPPGDGSLEKTLDLPYTRSMSDSELNALLDKARSAGADSVRTVGPWDHLEPAKDSYNWGFMDRFISAAEQRGMKVHMQVSACPSWVCPGGVWYGPRGDVATGHYNDLMNDLVARYGTRVSSYEVWNEPNHPSFWQGGSGPNPVEYAALLRAGYLGAKQANPEAIVIGGSLSQNDIGYMRALYDALRAYPDASANDDFFDWFGTHPYAVKSGTPLAPDAPISSGDGTGKWGYKNSSFLGIDLVRAELDSHGDSHKKVYLGEFGYCIISCWHTAISDSTRASYLQKAYALAGEREWVTTLVWYSYYGEETSGFNLIDRTTLSETQTFAAFRAVP